MPDLDPEACRMLERYAYPGNIRELQNILERAMIFCLLPRADADAQLPAR